MPQILKVESSIKEVSTPARKVLLQGGVIAFPTDTFYGLGADPFNRDAVDRIFEIKGREKNKPLFLLISLQEQLKSLVKEISPSHSILMNEFWPGPLTLLFEPLPVIPRNVTEGKVGIRQPGNTMTRDLISAFGHPITAPSANLAGEAPPTTAKQVDQSIGKYLDLIIDGGTCPGGEPSTLVDCTETPVKLIRSGAIRFSDIETTLQTNTEPNQPEVFG
ncbi:MAG: threonylcarbamoyl-AMP synthase [Nitrospinae bacterium]|nr:threonylcarbamoyl-AMP synthase [Nitrospinota bacterium]